MSVPYLPESAPFTATQRAYLNGFLAGLASGSQPLAASQSFDDAAKPQAADRGMNGRVSKGYNGHAEGNGSVAVAPAAQDDNDDFPWHDPALSLDERMELAKDRPPTRRLMAAMAQLDCGACGYVCKTYAEAIADGNDADLTKCEPGGRATAKKLKELVALTVESKPSPREPLAASQREIGDPPKTYSRANPFPARLLDARRLNRPDSVKDVRHVELSLRDSGLTYEAGDALGVWPENCPDDVADLLALFGASGAEDAPAIDGRVTSLHDALWRERTIGRPSGATLDLLVAAAADPADAAALKALADDDAGVPEGLHVADVLALYPSARPAIDDLVAALPPMQPRLYSIASSPAAHPGQVHLTVGAVRYSNAAGRDRKGACSTYLADRLRPGMSARVFVHASPKFRPPADPDAAMVMVGPGTGVAPFRAFLEHRRAAGARGRNWLFFGDQREATDFLYRDQLQEYAADGHLARLDTAFSRDQAEKVYVQHRMLEHAAELWRWLDGGAHFYVCGDAKRMATDVDAALHEVVATAGGLGEDGAKAYIKEMTRASRYQRDVY